jgi:hypothetical protein
VLKEKNKRLQRHYNPNIVVSKARNNGFLDDGLKSSPYCSKGVAPKRCFCQTS